ncbi:MAG: hypothetical protein K2O12_02705, partial [Muribaculaceae bacterium]|nr:hypothetical protein [Muribaculaceae bacterium]
MSGNNRDTRSIPSFTIPADLKAGVYRMRFKIDWNDIDPNGSLATGNTIVSNGGAITDIIVVVSDGSKVNVRANQLNGDVTSEDGELLNDYKTNFGEPLKVKMAPAPGFSYSGMKVRHGVLTGDSLYHDNPQYREIRYTFDQFDENDCITLPAEVIDGDVLIEGFFVEEGSTPRRATVTYNLEYNGKVIATKEIATSTGNPYPAVEWDTETSSEFYEIEGIPEGEVEGDATIALTLVHKLPFEISEDFNNAHWYNLTLTSDKVYLTHNPSANYISLTNPTRPASTDYNSQWCFVGDAFGGFKIFNRGAGESMILSSSHNTSANTGGSTYPVCTAHPVADGNNTYWIPTISSHLANGFYLHQIGYVNNKMNSRDERLAYWTGGYGAGSTFVATFVGSTSGIEDILAGDEDNTPSAYYNLQGSRVNANDLKPGIYI